MSKSYIQKQHDQIAANINEVQRLFVPKTRSARTCDVPKR